MPKGGPGRGQGRKPKPPGTGRKQVQISLPADLAAKLTIHGKKSKLIQNLLIEYFNKAPY